MHFENLFSKTEIISFHIIYIFKISSFFLTFKHCEFLSGNLNQVKFTSTLVIFKVVSFKYAHFNIIINTIKLILEVSSIARNQIYQQTMRKKH